VFSNRQQTHWHFVNVKLDGQDHNRSLYRRIAVGPQERLRTATDRLSMLDLGSLSGDLFGISPLTIQKRHDEAFDVEGVTKNFFEVYARVFARVESAIQGIGDTNRKRMFTQRLFNRLMFIAFIEKKGWLTFDGDSDYLHALWRSHAASSNDENFYESRLKLLFFSGLNRPGGSDPAYKHLIGNTPYLNGGLFEEDEDSRDPVIVIPNDAIDAILRDLFARFNFTVMESTPLDVEVAVDPEMLGKVFEKLVTGRHESGSYYTPKPVVSFMGREAIKGYLGSSLPAEDTNAVARFVDEHDLSGLRDPEAVLEALRRIKICDPACGSGAYILGLLQELLELRARLFARTKVDAATVYERKLEIIQNNVYGVDIDHFAVNIARLRLWLSLAVDHDDATPLPLPNLDFKIEVGDSLTAPSPEGVDFSGIMVTGFASPKAEQLQLAGMLPGRGVQLGFGDAQLPHYVERYLEAKREYLDAHAERKKELREEIGRLKAELKKWPRKGVTTITGFDWLIEFLEVFIDGGFDVVLANPPYVRQELIKDLKPALQRAYPSVYTGKADLYCYFYARAVQLLRCGGMLVFISSNKWFLASYGTLLRKYISDHCHVVSITDFGELPVFASAATFPMIFIAQKESPQEQRTIFTQVKTLEPPYPDLLTIVRNDGKSLPSDALKGNIWNLSSESTAGRLRIMESVGIPLRDYAKSAVYSGIKTGYNDAFWIDATTRQALIAADGLSAEVIKPLARGDDVRRWHIMDSGLYLIYTPPGFDINCYRAIKEHLLRFRPFLEKRAIAQPWWELQQAQNKSGAWTNPKIVYPFICKESRFTLDTDGIYSNMNTFILPSADLFLLGVLSSKIIWWYLQNNCAVLGDPHASGRLQLKRQYVERIPIPHASSHDRAAIAALVQKCLDAKGVNTQRWEQEINERVTWLYGLDVEE